MKKRLIAVILVLFMVMAMPISSGAAVLWTYTAACNPGLSFTGNTANCSLYVQACSSSSSISAEVYLFRVSGPWEIYVASWYDLGATGIMNWSDTCAATVSGTYRLYAYVTVTATGGSDYITRIATAVKS